MTITKNFFLLLLILFGASTYSMQQHVRPEVTQEDARPAKKARPDELLQASGYLDSVRPMLPSTMKGAVKPLLPQTSSPIKPRPLKRQLALTTLHEAIKYYKLAPEIPPVKPQMVPNSLSEESCFEGYIGMLYKAFKSDDFDRYFNVLEKRSIADGARLAALTFTNHKTTALHRAAQIGNIAAMDKLIQKYGVDANVLDAYNYTPLHRAAHGGSVESVKALLTTYKVDKEPRDKNGRTPLHLAARAGQVEVIRLLIKDYHFDCDSQDAERDTPLHAAAGQGQSDAISLLLELGAEADCVNEKGISAVHEAARFGHIKALDILIRLPGGKMLLDTPDGETLLHTAVKYNQQEVMRHLITQHGFKSDVPDKKGRTPLHYAAIKGFGSLVDELILQHGASKEALDEHKIAPLHWAVQAGQEAVVKSLLNVHKVNKEAQDEQGSTALHYAAEAGHRGLIKILIKEAKVNKEATDKTGNTAIHIAAWKGQADALSDLITEHGLKADAQNDKGSTAMHYAAHAGFAAIVKSLFIDHKLDANAVNASGYTPLHCAAENGRDEVINTLLVNPKVEKCLLNKNGASPMALAIKNGHLAACKALVRNGVSLKPDLPGNFTYLHTAASSGYVDIINFFIDEGIDKNCLGYSHTPLHMAIKAEKTSAIRCLISQHKVNQNDRFDGKNPLEVALEADKLESVRTLLELGSKIRISTLGQHRGISLTNNPEMHTLLKKHLSQDEEFLAKIKGSCCCCHEEFINEAKDINSVNFKTLIQLPCCKNFIHCECLTQWLKRSGSCPICRQNALTGEALE